MRFALPDNNRIGWGICGHNLLREFRKLPDIPDTVTLHAITGPDFAVLQPDQWNRINVGLCFIEDDITAKANAEKADRFDLILAGSKWNADWLHKMCQVNGGHFTQGVDPLFHYRPRKADGLFVVFSGGKAEYRKGTDIVIWAMSRFMRERPNVWLAAAWHNEWRWSLDTLRMSPYIEYVEYPTCKETLMKTLEANGVPLERVVLHPPLANNCMPGIYWDSDYGIFPNRCEAGNNMVLTEYMACGRPVAATYAHGHLDVLQPEWVEQHLTNLTPDRVYTRGNWIEPDPQEVLERLRAAYDQERELLDMSGIENAKAMQRFTWEACAKTIHGAITDIL